jgi:hypothetical protein
VIVTKGAKQDDLFRSHKSIVDSDNNGPSGVHYTAAETSPSPIGDILLQFKFQLQLIQGE